MDYDIAFGNNGDFLLKNWETYFPQIVTFLQKDGHIKDKNAKALLDNAFQETCDESEFTLKIKQYTKF